MRHLCLAGMILIPHPLELGLAAFPRLRLNNHSHRLIVVAAGALRIAVTPQGGRFAIDYAHLDVHQASAHAYFDRRPAGGQIALFAIIRISSKILGAQYFCKISLTGACDMPLRKV